MYNRPPDSSGRVGTGLCLLGKEITWEDSISTGILGNFYCLFGTNGACQLSPADIWEAWQRTTTSLHKIQQRAILISLGARQILSFPVNTNKVSNAFMVIMSCHQVTVKLFGPTRWTIIPCGHHYLRTT